MDTMRYVKHSQTRDNLLIFPPIIIMVVTTAAAFLPPRLATPKHSMP
jgi:hypothetical protein